ncbi:benzoate transport [Lipingzhangella halophila]|uniref:Benzoate transport n=1 Tax=Lipingzhangella halophila TaxID=1783352 RepID=A0A7W7RMT4_9ACTN|nr:MFS transporter [Lipingzhangella halophila]MBB4934864.1 benzoate transport [Lipingzhangella halophila]
MSTPDIDLRRRLDDGPMSRFQWSVIAVCVLLNVLDGFDVLVMAYTSDSVSAEWQLSGSQIGMLLSAGLVGMALGSLFLAPLADRWGRRKTILVGLTLAAVGMALSALSQNALQLGALRVFTGVGIGAILATSNVTAAEYANRRWRGLAVSLNSTGYAVGATLGGVLAAVLLSSFGWRPVFACGAAATALLIPVVLVRLPESMDFLMTQQRSSSALKRLNTTLRSMGQAPLEGMPRPVASETGKKAPSRVARILAPGQLHDTLLTWGGFFAVMFAFYFVTSWTPQLLVESGMSATEGVTGGTLLNLGGIFGSALLGFLAARFRLQRVLAAYLLITAALLVLFVPAVPYFGLLLVLGALIGVFVNGCVAGLYALTPTVYDPSIRGTGVGWAIGIGRIGAIVSPLAAGGLLDLGWGPGGLFLLVSGALVLGTLAVMSLRAARPAPGAGPLAEERPRAGTPD